MILKLKIVNHTQEWIKLNFSKCSFNVGYQVLKRGTLFYRNCYRWQQITLDFYLCLFRSLSTLFPSSVQMPLTIPAEGI